MVKILTLQRKDNESTNSVTEYMIRDWNNYNLTLFSSVAYTSVYRCAKKLPRSELNIEIQTHETRIQIIAV